MAAPTTLYVPGYTPNPATGRPFQTQEEIDAWRNQTSKDYQDWSAGQSAGAAAAGKAAGAASATASPGYNWYDKTTPGFAGVNTYYESPTGQDQGTIYFGNLSPGDQGMTYASNLQGLNSPGTGSIDPATGLITYYTYNNGGKEVKASRAYDPAGDYGLGSGALGVIALQRDKSGTPTAFYARTPGGGGKVFQSLADAQSAVQAYTAWLGSRAPTASGTGSTSPTTTTAGTGTTTGQTDSGILTKPGAGEQYFDSTKDFYSKPSYGEQQWGQMANQPTRSEQVWNAYSGKFTDPNYLDDYYGRQAKAAQTTLDRKSASSGWGDSGAAARATGNIGIQFADAARKGTQDWASTGATIAGQADSASNAKLAAALGVDTGTLTRIGAGQTAANSAENLQINRETGGLNSAVALGGAEASLMYSGLSQAQQTQLQSKLAELALQVQKGSISAQQGYQDAQAYLSAIGSVGNAATNYYIQNKLASAGTGAGAKA